MDAQVVEVDGQEMVHLETCRHGRGLDGFMDVVPVGIWDTVPTLALVFHQFQQLPTFKLCRVKEISLKSKSGVFRIV
jgi:hypothetical protein